MEKTLLSQKALRLRPSVMEEFSFSCGEGVIPFTAGQPAQEMLPLAMLEPIVAGVFRRCPELFFYPPARGDQQLHQVLARWMGQRGLATVDPEAIFLTNGALGGANLLAELLIDPGTVVVTENPTYLETVSTFLKEGATIRPLAMDQDGPIPEELEALARRERIKLFYCIPNFQNPTGRCTSPERRRAIVELAQKYDFLIFEDDPYQELFFQSRPSPSLLSLDPQRVIYGGSFSKIVAPGLRCGWLVIPPQLRDPARGLIMTIALSHPVFIHRALAELLELPQFEDHLDRLRAELKRRKEVLTGLLRERIDGERLSWEDPQGGMFLWCHLPGVDCADLARRALKDFGVSVLPGFCFTPYHDGERESLRLTFSRLSEADMAQGVQRLAQALDSLG